MRVFTSLGHKNLILLRRMRSCNEHGKMPKWGIFNASVLLNLYALYKDSGAFPKGKQDHVWWAWLELSHLPPS